MQATIFAAGAVIRAGSQAKEVWLAMKTFRTNPSRLLAMALLVIVAPLTIRAAEPGSRSPQEIKSAKLFDSQIAPLLARRCFECHDTESRKGKLDLSQKASALGERKGGRAIVPGNAAESLVWKSVEANEMPDERRPLSPEEKEALKEWIDSGAVWTADRIDPLAYTRDERAAYNWIRRLTVEEYIETVRSAMGVNIAAEARKLLPPDVRADGFYNTAYNLGADLQHIEAYSRLAEIIVKRMNAAAFAKRFSDCNSFDQACLTGLIAEMGRWLLRGPLDEHEIKQFTRVGEAVQKEGGDFKEAVSYVVEAMLQSPRFIYRIETQSGDGKPRLAGPYELASRLSYTIWGAPPDEDLMKAAESGRLADQTSMLAEVERMLKDPRAIKRSGRFLYEWLDLERLNHLRPNREKFPTWTEGLAADMREETLAFFEEVVWNKQRPVSELLNAQASFMTPRLAKFYGLSSKAKGETDRAKKDLQALYTFEEGQGDLIRDLSGAGTPIHLKIENPGETTWSRSGLRLNSAVLIRSETPATRLIEAIKKSREITIEAWIIPSDLKQNGPARIVTLSADPSQRNFTLGQDGGKVDVRFRTKSTDANGLPSLSSSGDVLKTRLTHVVYTRAADGKARMYIDGAEKGSRDAAGDLANWDANFHLGIGNEMTKDRPWKGTFRLVAVYSRALSPEEIRQNHTAGSGEKIEPVLAGQGDDGEKRPKGLLAVYRFTEGKGDSVKDSSGHDEPLNLTIESNADVKWHSTGLEVKKPTLISVRGPSSRLVKSFKRSNAITIEAWITPGNTTQKGPARIITLSEGPSDRLFTLGQDGDKYEVRFRTSNTDANGHPALTSSSGTVVTELTHIVYTRDARGKARLYLDGEEAGAREVSGDLASWEDKYKLAIANETTSDRPWQGTFHLLALYDRALTPEEIRGTSQRLAKYDLTGVPSRGGLLTQGSVLTIGGEDASMVARGLFILKDFLYSSVGNPPPCANTTPIPPKPGMTRRAIAQARVDNLACGGCHGKFEPLAFALEKFDGLGAYHEEDEHGNKLREDGEITFPGEEKPAAYKTSAELMDLLAKSPRVQKNFTRKLTQFAIGRPLVESDAPIIDNIHARAQKEGGTYASLIKAIVTSDLIRMTQTEAIR